MSKTKLICYRILLLVFIVHYYGIIQAMYLDTTVSNSEKGFVTIIVASVNMPLNLLLALIRLWILRPIKNRLVHFEGVYFAIPITTIVLGLSGQIWGAIVLSFIAGILIVYEFFLNILKKEFILTRITSQEPETFD